MRKTSYVVTFLAVAVSLTFTILSVTRVDWLVYKSPKLLGIQLTLQYGLNTLCELKEVKTGDHSKYMDKECRPFPMRVKDGCEENHSGFCAAWTSAGYTAELSIALAALALFAILVGISTGSRRRRIWKAVAGLVALHAAMQIVTFAIVTDTMRTGAFPSFDEAKPGLGYAFNAISWILSVLITAGVVITGISADQGQKWAAGNRAYRRIPNA